MQKLGLESTHRWQRQLIALAILATLFTIPDSPFLPPTYSQQISGISFDHEANGTVQLELLDSVLTVQGLGGKENFLSAILGKAPTKEIPSTFIFRFNTPEQGTTNGSSWHLTLNGIDSAGISNQYSTLHATVIDSTTTLYSISEVQSNQIQVIDGYKQLTTLSDTNQFSFYVQSASNAIPMIECGYARSFKGIPYCVWTLHWDSVATMYAPGVDTVAINEATEVRAIVPHSFPTYVSSATLTTESIPEMHVVGEAILNRYSGSNLFSCRGRTRLQVTQEGNIIATGFIDGTKDGVDIVQIDQNWAFATTIEMKANLKNKDACIYTTFANAVDTLGFVGFVRDGTRIRLFANINSQESDSSDIIVKLLGAGVEYQTPQNQIAGWIDNNICIASINATLSFCTPSFTVILAEPVTIAQGSVAATTHALGINATNRVWSDYCGNTHTYIRAGDIDTLTIVSVQRIPLSVQNESKAGETEGIVLLPNPVQNELKITWKNDANQTIDRIEVYDMNGKYIDGNRVQPYSGFTLLNCTNFFPGTYLVVALNKNGHVMASTTFVKS